MPIIPIFIDYIQISFKIMNKFVQFNFIPGIISFCQMYFYEFIIPKFFWKN